MKTQHYRRGTGLGLLAGLTASLGLAAGAHADSPKGRYTVAAETVRDERTGLMWQRAVPTESYSWSDAKAYCDALVLAGLSDWRLPNRPELESLVDRTRVDPAIDPVAFPDTPKMWFWSSSPRVGAERAWLIYFETGAADTIDKASLLRVRCTR